MRFQLLDPRNNDSSECDLRWGEKWLAVDLDGVLCHYDKFEGHDKFGTIIESIACAMEARHQAGWRIAIFTSRADTIEHASLVAEFLSAHQIGCDLITNVKKPYFKEFWDDRAFNVPRNSGIVPGMVNNQLIERMNMPAFKNQVGGSHYKDFPIQVGVFNAVNNIGSYEAAIVKYACRHENKDGIKDLKKIIECAQQLAAIKYGVDI